jgi:hypothetical protein
MTIVQIGTALTAASTAPVPMVTIPAVMVQAAAVASASDKASSSKEQPLRLLKPSGICAVCES